LNEQILPMLNKKQIEIRNNTVYFPLLFIGGTIFVWAACLPMGFIMQFIQYGDFDLYRLLTWGFRDPVDFLYFYFGALIFSWVVMVIALPIHILYHRNTLVTYPKTEREWREDDEYMDSLQDTEEYEDRLEYFEEQAKNPKLAYDEREMYAVYAKRYLKRYLSRMEEDL